MYVSLCLGLGIVFHDFNDDVDSCALLAGFCLRIRGSGCGLVTNHEMGGRLQCEQICKDVRGETRTRTIKINHKLDTHPMDAVV